MIPVLELRKSYRSSTTGKISRVKKLAEALEEIGQLELINPVITGQWRSLCEIYVVQTQVLVNPAGKQAIPPHVINEAAPQDVPPPPAAQPGNKLKV